MPDQPSTGISGRGLDLECDEGPSDHCLASNVGPTALLDMLGRWEALQALRVSQDGSPRLRCTLAAAECRHQVFLALFFSSFSPPSGGTYIYVALTAVRFFQERDALRIL